MPLLPVFTIEEAVEEEPVREEGRRVTAGFCEREWLPPCEREREGKASVFCLLLEAEPASLREASKERIEARFLIMPRLQPT